MSKVAIVTDSNSGITQDLAKEMGIFVIPMPFMIDNEDYYEGINLTQKEFYEKLESNSDVKTSQPSPDNVMTLWDDILKDYDELVFIPMSSGLSGTCQTASMLAEDYNNKVFVVNNQRISITQKQSVKDALRLANEGKTGEEIKQILEDDKFNSSIYIMLDTLKYLKKGGRITPAAAAIGELLKLKPVLQIQGEKLDAFAKARTSAQGKTIIFNAIKADAEKRFGGLNPDNVIIEAAYTNGSDIDNFMKEIHNEFPGFEIEADQLSLSVSCHIGPGSLAMAVTQKLK